MILKKPLITEKMTAIMDKRGQYGFVVDKKSTKDEIKKAIVTLKEGFNIDFYENI